MAERTGKSRLGGKRIGLLLAGVHTGASPQVWPPLAAAAEAAGADLYVFPGGRLGAAEAAEAARNRLFRLVGPRNLDGAVSWASSLGGFVDFPELDAFHARLAPLPLVTLAHRVPGAPLVRVDAYAGLLSLLKHLSSAHGCSRPAFIRGPAEHDSAQERWRAFRDFHLARGAEPDPRLVSAPRPWSDGLGGADELLGERGLVPGRDFDVLLAASDLQLHDALPALSRRGYSVPEDVAAAGCSDSAEARISSPPFSTVRLPFAEQSERAFAALAEILEGRRPPEETVLPGRVVLRRSCGCLSAAARAAGAAPEAAGVPVRDRGLLRAAAAEAACRSLDLAAAERAAWVEPAADAYVDAVCAGGGTERTAFLRTLDRIMERLLRLERDPGPWQDALSALRVAVLSRSGAEIRARAEELASQGRVIVSEAVSRWEVQRRWKAAKAGQGVRDLERDLLGSLGRDGFGSALAAHLPGLGIGAAYLVEEDEAGVRARLSAGFDERGVLAAGAEFPAEELLPPEARAPGGGRTWIVEPLCAGGQYFGRLLLRAGNPDGEVYEELRSALASALQGARAVDALRLAREAAERAERLKTRFLASASGELRSPLLGILEAASGAGAAFAAGDAAAAGAALSAISASAAYQLLLTDEMLDLARSEAGELRLDAALVRPEAVMALAMPDSGGAQAPQLSVPASLPLVCADAPRLGRLLARLCLRAAPARLRVLARPHSLAFEVVRRDGRPAEGGGGDLPDSLALASRVLAAHCGRLEELRGSDGSLTGWLAALPFPAFGGGDVPGLGDERAPLVELGTAEAASAPARALAGSGAAAPRKPGEVEKGGPAAALVWAPAPDRLRAEAAALRRLSRRGVWAEVPFLIYPPPGVLEDGGSAAGVDELLDLLGGAPGARGFPVHDADEERGRALAESLARSGLPGAAWSGPYSPRGTGFAVVRLEELGSAPAPEARTLLVLCGLLDRSADLEGLCALPRAVLLNEGVLDEAELAAFAASLKDARAPLPSRTGALVKRAQLLMNARLSADLSRWKLADAAGVSEDYLSRVFRRELGLPPWDYLLRLRVHAARRLLRESGSDISAVAAAVGIADQAYFCRVFKRFEGRSPSAYRASF